MLAIQKHLARLLPRSRLEVVLYVFVLFCALRPWVLSWVLYPHDPAAVRVMYRSPEGDFEYFILSNTVARGNFGEGATYELSGTGVQSFPMASVVFHVVATALFGPLAGYILTDIVLTFLFFFVFRAWCRLFSSNELWTNFLAALFVTGCPQICDSFGFGLVHLGGVWGWRIPRPFVTDIYFVAGVVLLTAMTWKPEFRARLFSWVLVGAVMALCLQSLIYYLPALGVGAAAVALLWLLEDRRALGTIIGRVACSIAAFAVLILPFLYQRIHGLPDGPLRLGLIPIDRGFLLFHTPWWKDPSVLAGLVILALLAFTNRLAARFNLPSVPPRVIALLAAMQVAAFVGIPLTGGLTGKLIQAYHFFPVTAAVQTCILVALVATIGLRFLPKAVCHPVLAGLFLVFASAIVPYHTIHRHLSAGPMRPDMIHPPGAQYHRAFSALVRELNRDTYKGDLVVATIDDQVYAYWVGFHGRYAFFPQTFLSAISMQESDDRVLWFAREEGMDSATLARFLNQQGILAYWMGSSLYQCGPLYQMKPLSDYSPQDIKNNVDIPIDYGAFYLALPLSEMQRLQDRYAQILAMDEAAKPRLDLIILTADTVLMPLNDPDPARYTLTYHDDYFRVFQAIKPTVAK